MITFKKIMCPIDFSEPSLRALNLACDMAVKFDAELEVIHVIADLPIIAVGDAPFGTVSAVTFDSAEYREDMEKNAARRMEEIVARLKPLKVKTRTMVKYGYPSDVIIATVQAEKTDLLVMSTHGCSGFKCFLFGSVAEKVIKTTPCPVLVIGPVEMNKAGSEGSAKEGKV